MFWLYFNGVFYVCRMHELLSFISNYICAMFQLSAWPEVRGTADTDGGAYSSSYSLTTLSSSSSTDRRAETDRMVITTRIAVAHHFICRLRRRESCILGATSSQPTLPLHELPPARLVIRRQTSAHERRKRTLSVQSRSGILANFCPRQH